MFSVISSISIRGIAASVPKNTEDNYVLFAADEAKYAQMQKTLGIRFRPIALQSLCASDLCVDAAQNLLDNLSVDVKKIDVLIFVSQTHDHIIPGSATQIHNRLGMKKSSIALDINQGCAGYVYGLSVISSMMRAMNLKKGLLLVGDTISKTIRPDDTTLRPVFADAGSATFLELNNQAADMQFSFGTDGSQYQAIHIPDGGAKTNFEYSREKGRKEPSCFLNMNGHSVFTFGLTTVVNSIKNLLQETHTSVESIDFAVFHQANKLLLQSIGKQLGIKESKVPYSLYNFGNTSSATIPLTIVNEIPQDCFKEKRKLLLSGFGVGLSWANTLIEVKDLVLPLIRKI